MPTSPTAATLASAYLALLADTTVVAERDVAVADAVNAQAMLSDSEALIAALELKIEKLRRELRGQRSERTARLLDQLELQLEELVMAASGDEAAAQVASAKASTVRSFTRQRPVRKPWPENIERERVVIDPPTTCACCGSSRLSKLDEDITETVEKIPRRFKVIETVREKFSCRDCEVISQPPAAVYYASSDRCGEHPQMHLAQYGGILQTDCYNGFEPIAVAQMKETPITFAFCHTHARRKFFELADIEKSARDRKRNGKPISPIALEAVKRFDALFDDMHEWLKEERATLSSSSDVVKAMDYMLKRWDGFARFLEDGRICLTNNAAERALRGIALGRRNWTFAGSRRGVDRAAIMLTFIMTCRLNDVDPKAWLADVLASLPEYPNTRLHELLPWAWKQASATNVELAA